MGVASYVAAFSWYFFGLICWMRDDLPLLSSPSTRMCTSLSFFESAAVRRFNIAKYKKAQVKDTWILPDAHPVPPTSRRARASGVLKYQGLYTV